jgi:hypothetical protein
MGETFFQHDTERTTEWVNKATWLSISPDDPDAALCSCLDQIEQYVQKNKSHARV